MEVNSTALFLYLPFIVVFTISIVIILRLNSGSATNITISFMGMKVNVEKKGSTICTRSDIDEN